ncbi:hypothetical protein [Brevibacterium atlanticum]|uniref:hypothetical protein n=1 Tax=Brevibacterium atlanticum TaxID=2697563 RepID=UPI0014244466|nr:hypothetical protein [Brevibacterium atlanticum]
MSIRAKIAGAPLVSSLLMTGISSTPAMAATDSVTGYLKCPSGKQLNVVVTLEGSGNAVFYLNGKQVASDTFGGTHGYRYPGNGSGGRWKVTTNQNIKTVSDYCTAAVL